MVALQTSSKAVQPGHHVTTGWVQPEANLCESETVVVAVAGPEKAVSAEQREAASLDPQVEMTELTMIGGSAMAVAAEADTAHVSADYYYYLCKCASEVLKGALVS